MSSTLSEGVRVPDIGSVNWGADVNFNWGLLNTCLANISSNVKVDAENTWTAPQTFTETISGSIDGVAARAVGDEGGNNIKTALAGKQPSLSQAQLDACNSGITAAAVQQISTNASNISGLQTAVSSKAADNAVVHLAGAETITGDKTWTGINAFTSPVHAVTNQSVPIAENPPAEIVGNNFRFIDNDRFWGQFIPVWGTDGSFRIELGISNWTTAGSQGYWTVGTKISKDFGTLDFYTSHANANLGTSTNKWKTLNGINPGALSLPDTYLNLDTTDWNLTGTSFNYVPSIDGWLFINVRPSNNYAYVAIEAAHMRNNSENTTGRNAMACIAVRKNVSTTITLVGASIAQARLVSCAGNV